MNRKPACAIRAAAQRACPPRASASTALSARPPARPNSQQLHDLRRVGLAGQPRQLGAVGAIQHHRRVAADLEARAEFLRAGQIAVDPHRDQRLAALDEVVAVEQRGLQLDCTAGTTWRPSTAAPACSPSAPARTHDRCRRVVGGGYARPHRRPLRAPHRGLPSSRSERKVRRANGGKSGWHGIRAGLCWAPLCFAYATHAVCPRHPSQRPATVVCGSPWRSATAAFDPPGASGGAPSQLWASSSSGSGAARASTIHTANGKQSARLGAGAAPPAQTLSANITPNAAGILVGLADALAQHVPALAAGLQIRLALLRPPQVRQQVARDAPRSRGPPVRRSPRPWCAGSSTRRASPSPRPRRRPRRPRRAATGRATPRGRRAALSRATRATSASWRVARGAVPLQRGRPAPDAGIGDAQRLRGHRRRAGVAAAAAASSSTSIRSWHGQPAERQISRRRRRCSALRATQRLAADNGASTTSPALGQRLAQHDALAARLDVAACGQVLQDAVDHAARGAHAVGNLLAGSTDSAPRAARLSSRASSVNKRATRP